MCGIFVCVEDVHPQSTTMDENLVNTISGLLQHRGPDNVGEKIINNAGKHLTFIHTRLAINGLPGSQPITDKEQTITLVINGEIFNWKELELELGYKCEQSDCEIVIPLYKKYKDDLCSLFNKLEGQFSFVLYDASNSHVLIGRDRIGVTPLYIGTSSYDDVSKIIVSSEIKCLTLSVNGKSLVDNIKVFYPRKYSYNHINDLSTKIADQHDYTTFYNITTQEGERKSFKNGIKQLLQKSVKLQTRDVLNDDSVDFGVLLSGGLDSSIIASLVVESAKSVGYTKPVKTFSIGVHKDVPDLIAARTVAEFLGTDHHEYYFSIEEAIQSVEKVIWHIESYDCTTVRASTPMYILTKQIKHDFPDLKVLYSGELADELFCYLYGANAPSIADFQLETIHLVSNVHMFDCLRANKSCMANSIEARVPFTDSKLVSYILSMDPKWKEFSNTNTMEKQILRDAFIGYLPNNILYRKKEQFSDGVSGFNGKLDNWIDAIKDYTEQFYSIEQFDVKKIKYGYNSPDTKEKLYYRELFCKLFCSSAQYFNTSELTVKTWEPKWSDTKDPSGRVQTFWSKN